VSRVISVKGKTLSDALVEEILNFIRENQIKPGDRIPSELDLAALFSVGRTTVREALQILTTMGVIQRSRRGTTLLATTEDLSAETIRVGLTERSVHSLYEARRVLEVAMAAMAAERATEMDLFLMRQEIARLAAAPPDSWEAILEADMGFHTRVAAAAGNEVLTELFNLVRRLLKKRMPSVPELPMVIQRSVAHHWEVYQAIADHDPIQAGQVMAKNLSNSERLVLQLFGETTSSQGRIE
jgi:GntR family transcriptional repressor for pyruvate dehydrogenase complex